MLCAIHMLGGRWHRGLRGEDGRAEDGAWASEVVHAGMSFSKKSYISQHKVHTGGHLVKV